MHGIAHLGSIDGSQMVNAQWTQYKILMHTSPSSFRTASRNNVAMRRGLFLIEHNSSHVTILDE